MARCDQGYICDVCGDEVEEIAESDLYLGYVIGEIPPEELLTRPERHIRCHPFQAQFIVDPEFQPPVAVEGAFDKRLLDEEYVRERERLVTRGWRRLREVLDTEAAIINYPLPEVQAEIRRKAGY